MVFAIAGLVLAIICYELDAWCVADGQECEKDAAETPPSAMDSGRYNQKHENIIRWATLIMSLCAIVCLIFRQYYKEKWFLTLKDAQLSDTKTTTIYNFYLQKMKKQTTPFQRKMDLDLSNFELSDINSGPTKKRSCCCFKREVVDETDEIMGLRKESSFQ